MNKSQIIRDTKAANPNAKPRELCSILKSEHSLEVSPAYVSTILSQAKAKQGRPIGKRGRPAGSKNKPVVAMAGADLNIGSLMAAKKFVTEAGGVSEANAALRAFSRLTDTE